MSRVELIAPCHFGLEAVLKKEIMDLGYEIIQVEDGRVTFGGEEDAICRANVFLRTAERILLKVGDVRAVTFEELFDKVKALSWERYIPSDGKFWVTKASSVKSRLFSPSDIQSIAKKAIVERLKTVYHLEWFPETGAEYPIRISFMKDEATVCLDTTGLSLHKRGYRTMVSKAPIKETLAAALINSVEKRPYSGGPFLRERHHSHRSCHDCRQYGSRHEPFLYGGEMDECPWEEILVSGG